MLHGFECCGLDRQRGGTDAERQMLMMIAPLRESGQTRASGGINTQSHTGFCSDCLLAGGELRVYFKFLCMDLSLLQPSNDRVFKNGLLMAK